VLALNLLYSFYITCDAIVIKPQIETRVLIEMVVGVDRSYHKNLIYHRRRSTAPDGDHFLEGLNRAFHACKSGIPLSHNKAKGEQSRSQNERNSGIEPSKLAASQKIDISVCIETAARGDVTSKSQRNDCAATAEGFQSSVVYPRKATMSGISPYGDGR